MPAAIKPVLPEVKVPPIPVSAEELAANPNAQAMADFNTAMDEIGKTTGLGLAGVKSVLGKEYPFPVNDNLSYLVAKELAKFLKALKLPIEKEKPKAPETEEEAAALFDNDKPSDIVLNMAADQGDYDAETILITNEGVAPILEKESELVVNYEKDPYNAINEDKRNQEGKEFATVEPALLQRQIETLQAYYPNEKPTGYSAFVATTQRTIAIENLKFERDKFGHNTNTLEQNLEFLIHPDDYADEYDPEDMKKQALGRIEQRKESVKAIFENPLHNTRVKLRKDIEDMLNKGIKSNEDLLKNELDGDIKEGLESEITLYQERLESLTSSANLESENENLLEKIQNLSKNIGFETDEYHIQARQDMINEALDRNLIGSKALRELLEPIIQNNRNIMITTDEGTSVNSALQAETDYYEGIVEELKAQDKAKREEIVAVRVSEEALDNIENALTDTSGKLEDALSNFAGEQTQVEELSILLHQHLKLSQQLQDLALHSSLEPRQQQLAKTATFNNQAYSNMYSAAVKGYDFDEIPRVRQIGSTVNTAQEDVALAVFTSVKKFEIQYVKTKENPLFEIISDLQKWLQNEAPKKEPKQIAQHLLKQAHTAATKAPHYYITALFLNFVDKWIKKLAPDTRASVESTLLLNNFQKRLQTYEADGNTAKSVKEVAEELEGPQRSGPGSKPSR